MVMQEYIVWICIYAAGAAMLVAGVAAYQGKWRRWARHMMAYEMGKYPQFGFLMLYAGLAVVFAASAGVAGSQRAPEFIGSAFNVAAVLALLLCIAAVTRLPQRLLHTHPVPPFPAAHLVPPLDRSRGNQNGCASCGRTGNLVLDWLQRRADRKPAGK